MIVAKFVKIVVMIYVNVSNVVIVVMISVIANAAFAKYGEGFGIYFLV